MVEALSHMSITVTSLDKSIAFYTDVVGMQLVELKSTSSVYQEEGDSPEVPWSRRLSFSAGYHMEPFRLHLGVG